MNTSQQTQEWFEDRLGKATASRVADLVAKTRSGYSAKREAYALELLAERLTGIPTSHYVNAAMQWGIDTEPQARDEYRRATGYKVKATGFHNHPQIAMSGASPDGLVEDDGLVEIKCPTTKTHIQIVETGQIPDNYQTQMLWQMACTGRNWCDFVSFDPRINAPSKLFIQRFERDDERIAELEAEVEAFLAELAEREDRLRKIDF